MWPIKHFKVPNSNTTLVKVKCNSRNDYGGEVNIQIQHLLKLNLTLRPSILAFFSNSNTTLVKVK